MLSNVMDLPNSSCRRQIYPINSEKYINISIDWTQKFFLVGRIKAFFTSPSPQKYSGRIITANNDEMCFTLVLNHGFKSNSINLKSIYPRSISMFHELSKVLAVVSGPMTDTPTVPFFRYSLVTLIRSSR